MSVVIDGRFVDSIIFVYTGGILERIVILIRRKAKVLQSLLIRHLFLYVGSASTITLYFAVRFPQKLQSSQLLWLLPLLSPLWPPLILICLSVCIHIICEVEMIITYLYFIHFIQCSTHVYAQYYRSRLTRGHFLLEKNACMYMCI